MRAKIEKSDLESHKRLKQGLAAKILSAKIKEDKLLVLCSYDFNNSFPDIDAYVLKEDWVRLPTEMEGPIGKNRDVFRLTIPSCAKGIYKIEARELGVASKLSYESIIVED